MKKTGNSINELLSLGLHHALYSKDGKWYHHLNQFPGGLIDPNGYISFNSQPEYTNSDFLEIGETVHVSRGTSQIPGYQPFSSDQKKLIQFHLDHVNSEETLRAMRSYSQVARNQSIVQQLKNTYENQCFICGLQLKLNEGKSYSEAHHIRPLGSPHNGPDTLDNLILLCPNHHVLADFGTIKLKPEKFAIKLQHSVSKEHVKYHNKKIFRG